MSSDLLDRLNPQQLAAATHPGGPMLVLAGAGSGKTRVLTVRIAWLVRKGVPADAILAVTFTNKAAREMRDRVASLVGTAGARVPWVGTFHGACLRFLRQESRSTRLRPGFVVIDSDDATAITRACLREQSLDDKAFPPGRVASRISRLKTGPGGVDAARTGVLDDLGSVALRVLPAYEERLATSNACDFDDLLLLTVQTLEQHEDVRRRHQQRLQHLLVDEYQDTNALQYRLIRLLSGGHGNVCAVGDEDQSIYRFRGADISNILDFEKDFPGTTVFRVEQNYRSTGHVLAAAGAVVASNLGRKGKTLWTEADDGEPVTIQGLPTDLDEAAWITRQVARAAEDFGLGEVAIAYRTNAQSRVFEESLLRSGIPHVVIGGQRFYERREVKDVLAYLRLVHEPSDDLAFERVVNVPARGVGKGAQESVKGRARERGGSLFQAASKGLGDGDFRGRAERGLEEFVTIIEELQRAAASLSVAELARLVVERTEYFTELAKEGPTVGAERRRNVEELVSAAAEWSERAEDGGLAAFLSELALASDTDGIGVPERVHLLTLHAAKGLEFDAVFMPGVEEGLFPHASAQDDDEDIEEERRLCYVGMTRARRRLVMTHADRRRVFGQVRPASPSRFLAEIPKEHCQRTVAAGSFGSAGHATRPDSGEGRVQHDGDAGRVHYDDGAGAVVESGGDARTQSHGALVGFFGDADIPWEDLSQDPEDAAPVQLRKGQKVRHRQYGVGTILSLEGAGPKTKLTVYFASRGRVKLVQEFAKLEPVH